MFINVTLDMMKTLVFLEIERVDKMACIWSHFTIDKHSLPCYVVEVFVYLLLKLRILNV